MEKATAENGLKRLFHLSSIFEKFDLSLVPHCICVFLIGSLFAVPDHWAGISFCFHFLSFSGNWR